MLDSKLFGQDQVQQFVHMQSTCLTPKSHSAKRRPKRCVQSEEALIAPATSEQPFDPQLLVY